MMVQFLDFGFFTNRICNDWPIQVFRADKQGKENDEKNVNYNY